ncbi:MAG: flagellar type III secretion system pore protein FliP [Desulfovibrionaceae bacterium]
MSRTALHFLYILPLCLCILSYDAIANQALLELSLAGNANERTAVALTLEILLAFTVLSLAPAIVLTTTSFTRLIIVFYFLRQAIGTNQMPPNQILISLAIFMTCAIMYPTGQAIYKDAFDPYFKEQISLVQALDRSQGPLRKFMFVHTREKDISLFYSITNLARPNTQEDVPTLILIPAFLISELKTAFTIGFLIYIPFVMLDMVISSVLLAMGMMMLPPMTISLPFKLLLFVMVDGWNLLIGSLVNTFMK